MFFIGWLKFFWYWRFLIVEWKSIESVVGAVLGGRVLSWVLKKELGGGWVCSLRERFGLEMVEVFFNGLIVWF